MSVVSSFVLPLPTFLPTSLAAGLLRIILTPPIGAAIAGPQHAL